MTRMKLIRICSITAWCILAAILAHRNFSVSRLNPADIKLLENAREETYGGIYLNRRKIGWTHEKVHDTGNELLLNQESEMFLNILGKIYPVKMKLSATLSRTFLLEDFIFNIHSPFYSMEAKGQVEGTGIRISIDTGKGVSEEIIRVNSPPFISLHMRSFLLSGNPEAGERIKVPWFDPLNMSNREAVMIYRGKEKVNIKGRVELLHHFEEHVMGMEINSWLNDMGNVVKEESPAGFVFLTEPEFKAKDMDMAGSKEILSTVAVSFSGEMPPPDTIDSIKYRLSFPEKAILDLDGGRQRWDPPILTLTREGKDGPECRDWKKALASTPYVQANNKEIKALADRLRTEKNAADTMARIVKWVYENIEKIPVIGIPDAVTTLINRKGDCNEHATLVAALARAAGIPTRIAAGVTLLNGKFYYHAWNESCVDNQWITADATRNQMPADLGHIRLVSGETSEMIRIGAIIGRLKIEVRSYVPVKKPAQKEKKRE